MTDNKANHTVESDKLLCLKLFDLNHDIFLCLHLKKLLAHLLGICYGSSYSSILDISHLKMLFFLIEMFGKSEVVLQYVWWKDNLFSIAVAIKT